MIASFAGFCVLYACSLLPHAFGVHLTRASGPDVDGDPNVGDSHERRASHLESLEVFEYMWKYRHARDLDNQKEMPLGLKIVFGVTTMSTPEMDKYWGIIQETWMQQRGVCTLGFPPRELPECSVYVTRVVGLGWDDRETPVMSADKFVINQTESMDNGKTFWLFHALARQVPWATHIAKVDVDAYPYIYTLVSFLHSQQECAASYQYMGRPYLHPKCESAPSLESRPHRGPPIPQGPPPEMYKYCTSGECGEPDLHCLWYMAGGLYILSRSLAFNATLLDGAYAGQKWGIEDLTLGRGVKSLVLNSKHHGCISLWGPNNAWHHQGQVHVDPDWPSRGVSVKNNAFVKKARNCVEEIARLGGTPYQCRFPGQ